VVAAGLIVLAAVVVLTTALSGSFSLAVLGGTIAFFLGAASAKITHSELRISRIEAARDRAQQAQEYKALTETRTAENLEFAADMQGRLAKRDAAVNRLEKRLADTASELAEARRELTDATERAEIAERETERTRTRIADAEERAADAAIRVAELEQQVDVLTSELQTWRRAPKAKAV
jgi:chromosome segregation ATPase